MCCFFCTMCSGSYSFTVGVDSDGMSARNFLRRICGLTARSMTVLKYAEGGITRSGELLRSCDTVHTGDLIDLRLPADVNDITPVEGELKILFEDDHILVADKPPYMPVHPVNRYARQYRLLPSGAERGEVRLPSAQSHR